MSGRCVVRGRSGRETEIKKKGRERRGERRRAGSEQHTTQLDREEIKRREGGRRERREGETEAQEERARERKKKEGEPGAPGGREEESAAVRAGQRKRRIPMPVYLGPPIHQTDSYPSPYSLIPNPVHFAPGRRICSTKRSSHTTLVPLYAISLITTKPMPIIGYNSVPGSAQHVRRTT
eukprot:3823910-Rhodomonas_salina.1